MCALYAESRVLPYRALEAKAYRKVMCVEELVSWLRAVEAGFSYQNLTVRREHLVLDEDERKLYLDFGLYRVEADYSLMRCLGLNNLYLEGLSLEKKRDTVYSAIGGFGTDVVSVRYCDRIVGFNNSILNTHHTVLQELNFLAKSWEGDWFFDRVFSPEDGTPSYGFWAVDRSKSLWRGGPHVYYPGVYFFYDPCRMLSISKKVLVYCSFCSNGLIKSRKTRYLTGRYRNTSRPAVERAFHNLSKNVLSFANGIAANLENSMKLFIDGFIMRRSAFLKSIGIRDMMVRSKMAELLPHDSYSLFALQHRITEIVQDLPIEIEDTVVAFMEKVLHDAAHPYSTRQLRILSPSVVVR